MIICEIKRQKHCPMIHNSQKANCPNENLRSILEPFVRNTKDMLNQIQDIRGGLKNIATIEQIAR